MQWGLVVAVIASTLVLSVSEIFSSIPFRDIRHVCKYLVFIIQETFTLFLRYLMCCQLGDLLLPLLRVLSRLVRQLWGLILVVLRGTLL